MFDGIPASAVNEITPNLQGMKARQKKRLHPSSNIVHHCTAHLHPAVDKQHPREPHTYPTKDDACDTPVFIGASMPSRLYTRVFVYRGQSAEGSNRCIIAYLVVQIAQKHLPISPPFSSIFRFPLRPVPVFTPLRSILFGAVQIRFDSVSLHSVRFGSVPLRPVFRSSPNMSGDDGTLVP